MEEVSLLRIGFKIDSSQLEKGMGVVLNNLNMVQKQFKASMDGVDKYNMSLDEMKAKSNGLSNVLEQQKVALASIKAEWEKVAKAKGEDSKEATKLEAKYVDMQVQINRTQRALEQTTLAMEAQAGAEKLLEEAHAKQNSVWTKIQGALGEGIKGLGKFSDGTIGLGGKLTDLGKQLDGLSKKTLAFGGVAAGALVGFGASSFKEFANFEQGMNSVFSLLPGESQKTFDDMTKQTRDFADKFNVLPEQVVPALYQALSSGIPKENVFSFMEVAQKAATASQADTETTVDGLTSVVNAYGEKVVNVQQASDIMFQTVNLGKTTFGELSHELYNVTPTASALGVKFSDIGAAIAAMTAKGVPASTATVQLKMMMDELSKSGTGASDTFKKMTGESFQQFISKGHTMNDALNVMGQAAQKNGKNITDMFSNIDAGQGALNLFHNSTYISDIQAMNSATGSTNKAYDQMNRGAAKSINHLKTTWADLKIDIGEKIAPAIEKAMDGLSKWIKKVDWNKFMEQGKKLAKEILPPLETVFKTITGALSHLDTNTVSMITTFGGIFIVLGPVLSILGTLISTIGLLISPIGLVVLAVGALIAIGWLVYNNWGTITKALASAWQWVKDKAVEVFSAIGTFFQKWGLDILSFLLGPIAFLAFEIYKHWDSIKSAAVTAFDSIVSFAKSFGLNIYHAIVDKIQDLGNAIGGAWSWVENGVTTIVDNITNFFSDIDLSDIGTNIIHGLGMGIENAWDWLKSKVDDVTQIIPDWMKKGLGIASPSRVLANEVGKWIPAGIAVGIEGNMKPLHDATNKMAQASIPKMNKAGMPMGVNGNQTTSTFAPNTTIITNDPFKAALEQQRLIRRLKWQGGM